MIQKLEKTTDLLYKISSDRMPRKEEKHKKHKMVCFNWGIQSKKTSTLHELF